MLPRQLLEGLPEHAARIALTALVAAFPRRRNAGVEVDAGELARHAARGREPVERGAVDAAQRGDDHRRATTIPDHADRAEHDQADGAERGTDAR